MLAWLLATAVKLFRQRAVQDVVHQRALARARQPGHHGQRIARNGDRHIAQVMLPRPPHVDVGDVRPPGLGRRGQVLRIQDAATTEFPAHELSYRH